VQQLPASTNLHVRQGQNLGYVENPRVDQQHLENLRVIEEPARSEADAMLTEQASLRQQQKELLTRAHAHSKAVSNRIQLDLLGDERLLLAKEATQNQAALDLERGRKLRESGIIADADFDRLQTQYDIAMKEAQAQEASVSAARAEADSAAKGIFIEPGYNEIDYSRQRFDDIRLRLADIDHSLAALQIQAQAAKEDLDKETQHAQLMTRADLISPISGLLWKLDAVNGERVGTGDSVAEFVDCEQAFVLVEIPQDRVPDLALGSQARVRLSGELEQRLGILASLTVDPREDENRKLAALPTRDHKGERTLVRVDLNPGDFHGECLVGRTARVLLSTNGSSIASRWFRRSF
jgi:multidrug resistance efflux pump